MVDPPGTSKWAALREEYGRSKPYNLDTLEIGNEDDLGQGQKSYRYRFQRFTDAITNAFPHKKFQYIATDSQTVTEAPAVDMYVLFTLYCTMDRPELTSLFSHDYVVAQTFIDEYNRYDGYPRNNTKLYALEVRSTLRNIIFNLLTGVT